MGEIWPSVRYYPNYYISVTDVYDATSDSIEGMVDMGDVFSAIPVLTLCTSGYRNYLGVKEGRKDVQAAVEHTVLDTAGVGGGGFIGSQIGLTLGLILAPATGGLSAIIIPAAATFIGSIAGILSGKGLADYFKARKLRKYIGIATNCAVELYNEFVAQYHSIVEYYTNAYYEKITAVREMRRNSQNWFMRMLFPTPLVRFTAYAEKWLRRDQGEIRRYYEELYAKAESMEAGEAGLLVYAQGRHVLAHEVSLNRRYDALENALKAVDNERNRIR